MNKFQQQNQAEWERIALAMPLSGMHWIVCDRYEKRQSLIREFAERFPDCQHICTTAWGFEENHFEPSEWTSQKLTLEAFLRLHFELNGGEFNGKPAILHLTAIESYLVRNRFGEFPTGQFRRTLEVEWAAIAANLPFSLVFWSGPDCLAHTHERMPTFYKGLVGRYFFETNPFVPKQIDVWICHFTWGNLGSFSNLDLTYAKLWEAYQLALAGKELQARRRISEVFQIALEADDLVTKARCQVALGKGYMLDGDYDSAIEWLSEGIMTHILDYEGEDADEAIAILAKLLITLERYEEAVTCLIEAYNRGGQYGWMPRQEIRTQFSIVLQKLVPDRKQEVLLLLYDKGFRLGETKIDGSEFTDRHPW